MDQESDFLQIECGRSVDGGVDRLSQLPDDIIVIILSFLRLKEAAATSVLSARWLNLWKYIPYLNFDMHIFRNYDSDDDDYDYAKVDEILCNAQRDKCIEIVNSVTQSHKALSLKKFRCDLPFNKIAKCAVIKWLEFVFSRQVESLELLFHEFSDLVLEELVRESRICLQPQTDPQTDPIFFESLERLSLGGLTVSGEDIKLFLRNCPLLEQLIIPRVTLTSDVELCGANLVLKYLEISNIRCNGQKTIKVSAPNLTCIRFFDGGEEKLLLENVPKLVEAYFDNRTPDMVAQCFASSASYHFSQLQILDLQLCTSELLFRLLDSLANGFQMPNLKKLVILCSQMNQPCFLSVTPALIWAFPRLEEFKLKYYELSAHQPAYVQVMADDRRSPHQHLEVFQLLMWGRPNVNDHIAELVMYISNNCVALRNIIIDRQFKRDPATWDIFTQQLQDEVPNHIQLKFVNRTL